MLPQVREFPFLLRAMTGTRDGDIRARENVVFEMMFG